MFAGIILFKLQDKDALLVALAYKTISFKLCAHIVIFLVCKPAFYLAVYWWKWVILWYIFPANAHFLLKCSCKKQQNPHFTWIIW